MSFTHLHVHTEYSLLDGAAKIPALVARAAELGMDSLAITDHGVMYGAIAFYKACREVGIKPILGCEVYVAPGSRFDKNASKDEKRYYHLVLLAENNVGYHNLMKLVSRGFTEGYYHKPRVDKELLREYHEGLICLSACLAGEIASTISMGFKEEARDVAKEYLDIFGEGNYFLEIQDHCTGEQTEVNMEIMKISKELGIPLVCTNDSHYVYAEDAEMHDYLLCIQTGTKYNDPNRMRYVGGQYYLKSEEEMRELFGSYAAEALDNTAKIAERCNVEIVFGEQKLPRYPVPEEFKEGLAPDADPSYAYLVHLCNEGLHRKYETVTTRCTEQLTHELTTIKNMGYVDYFLIVWDFINYSRTAGIPVGPGRGSAAGSIVAYTLGITDIDPLKYNLIFERFLNPGRVTMPDVDTDFCSEKRYDVIQYVMEKYGRDKAVQIVTFNTMKAKASVTDVGRVLDLPIPFVRSISKLIPGRIPEVKEVTLAAALQYVPEFREMYDTNDDARHVIDIAMKLEGLPRSSGTHPAGVVIVEEPIDEYVPLANGANGPVVQFTMTEVEELGLLKMDFLALRTLTMIENIMEIVRMKDPELDLRNIPLDDPAVYQLLSSGDTDGVFQLESSGMKKFMTELKPGNLEDVIAGISLYRPGPMDVIPQYIEGKENPASIHYDTPQLESILSTTYGCAVYQEQVMQIVMKLAGYNMAQSDEVRRAMSKKKLKTMELERKSFVYGDPERGILGCVNNGVSEDVANKIYDKMIKFSAYAFNKSHAAAYAVVSYQTAYLKAHYPVEFMAGVMTSFINNITKVTSYIMACRKKGIKILPPDINKGIAPFSVHDGMIVYGLSAIKGVGEAVIDDIVEERSANGDFTSLQDFVERMTGTGRRVNKKVVEQLILAGAFDSLPGNRRQKMAVYPIIMDHVVKESKHTIEGQMSIMDLLDEEEKKSFEVKLPDLEEYEMFEKLALEKAALGIYVSGHPLQDDKELMDGRITAISTDFYVAGSDEDEEGEDTAAVVFDDASEDEEPKIEDGSKQVIGGMVAGIRKVITKRGEEMAFVQLEDFYGSVEVVVFPKTYGASRNLLTEDRKVFVSGKAQVDDDSIKLLADSVEAFEDVRVTVWLKVEDQKDYVSKEKNITRILAKYPGPSRVKVQLYAEKKAKEMPAEYNIGYSAALIRELKAYLGDDCVLVRA